MAKVLISDQYLSDIANAIRGQNGSQNTYTPAQMATAITAISNGGGNNSDYITGINNLVTKMINSNYEITGNENLVELVGMINLVDNATFTLIDYNDTDRFITVSGKYMLNAATKFNCFFWIYKIRGAQYKYKLTTNRQWKYMNYLIADSLPEYNTTGLPVKDFTSGTQVSGVGEYLYVSLTAETASQGTLTFDALTVTEIEP